MTPMLRPATGDDLIAVQEVVRSAYTPYRAIIGRDPGPMLDDYDRLIRDGRVHVVVHDGTVKAILVLIPQDGVMLLDNIAVLPTEQGTGLGRAMLGFAESAAIAAGYASLVLYTNAVMTGNIALYARRGYAETHRIEEKGLRRVYMRKLLAPSGEKVRP